MKSQWMLILGIIFALIVALFAVVNVEPVTVNYFFGTADWPLILVILGSVLMGGLITGLVGLVRVYHLQKQLKLVKKANEQLKSTNDHPESIQADNNQKTKQRSD